MASQSHEKTTPRGHITRLVVDRRTLELNCSCLVDGVATKLIDERHQVCDTLTAVYVIGIVYWSVPVAEVSLWIARLIFGRTVPRVQDQLEVRSAPSLSALPLVPIVIVL